MRVLGQIHFNCTLFYVCTGPHCTTCFKIGKRWSLTLLNSSAIYNSTCAEKINFENGDCYDILEKVVLSEDSSQWCFNQRAQQEKYLFYSVEYLSMMLNTDFTSLWSGWKFLMIVIGRFEWLSSLFQKQKQSEADRINDLFTPSLVHCAMYNE